MEVGRGEGGPIFPPLMAVPLQGGGYALLLPGPRPNRPPPGLPPPVTQGVWGVVIALAVAGIASILASRAFAAPLTRLSDAARELGSGNLSVRVKLARSDELGALAEAFDEMAERLQLLLRGQQELLANVSHELRTPLARIRVALDLASEGDAAMAREALGEIAEDLGELEVLVADVLRMARLDLAEGRAGTAIPPLKAVRVEPRALLDSSVARFRSAHPERALTLEVPAALPECSGDPVLLRRVVDNLLDNARKYSEADIVLRASHTDDQLHLVVQDRGIGIAPEDLPLVAQPFFRADKSRARKTGGLGLGLSLARRIVEAHGGSLRIESAVGVGTSVHVQLPCGRPLSPPSVA
jgi:two-component system OmpR family sensor kinase